jgi:putative transposase
MLDLPREERVPANRLRKGEHGVWQRHDWEHAISDDADFAQHADYIHFDPFKHGLVARVRDWPFSPSHPMVRLGVYPT